jgi:hypothetical protein
MTINEQSKGTMHALKVSCDSGASRGARRTTEAVYLKMNA